MNKIAQFAVKYPVTVLMFVLGIVLLGFISFGKLGTDLFPDLNNPKIYIELKAGQKPPEEIEKNYVEQIESLATRQSDVLQVSSVSQVGSASITVEYDWNKDMDEAFLDLQKELNAFRQNSDLESFTISQYDPNASPVMLVGLKNKNITNMDELRKVAENYIRNELVRIEGVADVKLTGSEQSEVVIETNKYLLESYGLTSDVIAAQVNSYNKNVSGGSIVDMGLKYVVKGVSVLKDINDLENIVVGFKQADAGQPVQAQNTAAIQQSASGVSSGKIPVYLRDVAKIKFANKDPQNIVTINGERCIGLSIYKEPKFNTVEVVKSLDKALGTLSKALPGYQFIGIQDQGKYISNAINEVKDSTLAGIFLAVIILYIFLRRIGTTVVISLAIPISIVATFNLMYFSHLTLNIMTLGGLALGAGRLVDDAIVVLENITRNREEGMSLRDAAITGTGQVGGAITASTITTIVVFLPIVYLHGASGEMFKDQAWTVAFALISSLFVAMLVIPMLINTLFRNKKGQETRNLNAPLQFRWYSRFLSAVLEKRKLIIILSLLLMGLCGFLIPKLGSEFMPRAVSSEFTIELTLPEATSLAGTQNTVQMTENSIKELLGDKVEMIYSQTGGDNNAVSSNPSVIKNENYANIKVFLKKEYAKASEKSIELVQQFLKTTPDDIKVKLSREESSLQTTLGTNVAPFVVEIKGKEFPEMERILNEARSSLQSNSGLYNITSSLDEGTPEVEIVIDRFKTSYFNVSVDNVINQIKSYLTGISAGNFEKDGELKDITVKLDDITLKQLQDLIITAGSVKLPLSELAEVKTVISPHEVTRSGQTRTCYLYAMVNKTKPFDQIVKDSEAELKNIVLPVDYKIDITGEELKRKETMSNLSFALLLSVILVFMVLAAEFESIIQPFVILLTMPFAAVGTILTFLLFGKSLNMMAYIGIIMLCGIAVSNAIILIDRINQLRESGLGKKDSIVTAGSQRIRPILMTSLTTIFALVPLTIGIGESASLRSPMALAVIGGMVSSTILTLVVIPCVYWSFDTFSNWLRGGTREIAR
jgi:hydrophobic/amphiphilic exporter-1 (mainly G- bacteria), HAE1 family